MLNLHDQLVILECTNQLLFNITFGFGVLMVLGMVLKKTQDLWDKAKDSVESKRIQQAKQEIEEMKVNEGDTLNYLPLTVVWAKAKSLGIGNYEKLEKQKLISLIVAKQANLLIKAKMLNEFKRNV